jgi:hypothetical protein
MNGFVKAICCRGSDACNGDPHTISGNRGHRPQCCHVSRVLFNELMCSKGGGRLSEFYKTKKVPIFTVFVREVFGFWC